MDNKTKKVMKNFKRQEAVHEGREKYLNKLKGSISNGATKSGSRDISNASRMLPMPPPVPPTLLPVLSLVLEISVSMALPWLLC